MAEEQHPCNGTGGFDIRLDCLGPTEGRCESCDGAIGNIPIVAGNRGTSATEALLNSLKYSRVACGGWDPTSLERCAFNRGIDKAITALKVVGIIPKQQ